MSDHHTYKKVELVGSSPVSIEDAINNALAEAAKAVLEKAGVPLIDAASMPEAVRTGAQRAHAGDAVLMSPACASFDMFRNYEHRAEVFRSAVRGLADEAGVELEARA